MPLLPSILRSRLRRFRYLPPLLLLLAVLVWYGLMLRPAGNGSRVYTLMVPKGAGFTALAQELEKRGMVRRALQLQVLGRLTGLDRRMQPGEYRLTDAMKPEAILEKLASGVSDACKFTLPEGYSTYQAAVLLDRQGIFSRNEFLRACRDRQLLTSLGIDAASAEGYLFPSTYLIGLHLGARGLVTEMVREFRHRTAGLGNLVARSGLTMAQVVTLASMVEKEAMQPEERPLIASVFRNRLKLRMPLQSDPTAIYGVRAFGGTVTRADLQRPSPYNTYRIKGLPPGPIGNPGMDAIKAVLEPAVTPYLYFVARKDGTHQFSCTLAEHNRGVQLFLKKGKRG